MKIIIDGKTVDIGEACASGEVYSTEEVRIGTWIDGKPLYRMVIPDIDVKNEGNVNTVIYEVPSSEMYIVSHEEHTAPKKYPTEKRIGNFYSYATNFTTYTCVDGKKIQVYSAPGAWSDTWVTLILNYTKTTD